MSTSTTAEPPKIIPGLPGSKDIKSQLESLDISKSEERFYILYYRFGNVPHLSKVFKCAGTLRDAIQRGREHCVRMNYMFMLVRPFVIDLDECEKLKKEDPNYQDYTR